MIKKENLGDYVTDGKHEFVAFVRDMKSVSPSYLSEYNNWGNDLGTVSLGILVCERKLSDERENSDKERAVFFYKSPVVGRGLDIMRGELKYDSTKIVHEVPLGLEIPCFDSLNHLKKGSKEFREARKLLKRYGIY